LADTIAQAIECAESAPSEHPPNPPSLAEATRAIASIRRVLSAAELRLEVLGK
jgi:hypothetical protein